MGFRARNGVSPKWLSLRSTVPLLRHPHAFLLYHCSRRFTTNKNITGNTGRCATNARQTSLCLCPCPCPCLCLCLGNLLLWGPGALGDSDRECAGFLIMPKRPYEWHVDANGRYKFNNADLALGPRHTTAHFRVVLHLRTTHFPGPDSITRSEQAQQKRLERKATKHERRQCRRKLTQPSAS